MVATGAGLRARYRCAPIANCISPTLGPTWILSAPYWLEVGPTSLAIRKNILDDGTANHTVENSTASGLFGITLQIIEIYDESPKSIWDFEDLAHPRSLLLTWININLIMDNWWHAHLTVQWNYLSFQRCRRRGCGISNFLPPPCLWMNSSSTRSNDWRCLLSAKHWERHIVSSAILPSLVATFDWKN